MSSYRNPASVQELISGSRQILRDLSDAQVFNPSTCPTFVNQVTDYMFFMPADHFVPKSSHQIEQLKAQGPEVMETILKIRIGLHEKLKEFDAKDQLSSECVAKVREGFQYARFA